MILRCICPTSGSTQSASSSTRRGLGEEEFKADQRTIDAVAWDLAIVGEAVKNIPSEVEDKAPRIEWRKIAGFRDVLVHGYFGIDTDILWDVVENEAERLLDAVEGIDLE